MKTGVRLVKDEEKVNDFSSYEMNTRKASLPPTSDIKVQTFFSCSFLNRRDKKGIVNVNKISESAWGCIFLCIFLKRSWIYHLPPKVSYCSNFSSSNHFTYLLITCKFEDISYFLGKNLRFSWVPFYYTLPTSRLPNPVVNLFFFNITGLMWTPKYTEKNEKEATYYQWDQSSWEWNIDYVTKPIQETKTENNSVCKSYSLWLSCLHFWEKRRQNKQNQWELAFVQL